MGTNRAYILYIDIENIYKDWQYAANIVSNTLSIQVHRVYMCLSVLSIHVLSSEFIGEEPFTKIKLSISG